MDVSAKEPEYYFTQKLPQHYPVKRKKTGMLECFVSDPRAFVKWYRNGEQLEVGGERETYTRTPPPPHTHTYTHTQSLDVLDAIVGPFVRSKAVTEVVPVVLALPQYCVAL